jgi:hypothetical protein
VILGTSRNGLGNRWHIAAGTEKKTLPKSAWLWHIRQSCDVCDMQTVGPTIERRSTVGKLDAES